VNLLMLMNKFEDFVVYAAYVAIVSLVVSGLFSLPAQSAHVEDPRYCGEPKRTPAGKILRNKTLRLKFEAMYPLPTGWDRALWQVDHVIPLAHGGCDSISNMQWLPKSIKTCSGTLCKDRWELKLYPEWNGSAIPAEATKPAN